MSFANFKVIRVVSRSNLNNTSTKFHINIFISNNWNFSVYKRNYTNLAYNILISFIIWMNCNGIPEDCK